MRHFVLLLALLLTSSLHAAVTPIPSKAQLHEWMTEALATAEKVPEAQRRDAAYAIGGSREIRIRENERALVCFH